jgi:hypothetical protein
MPVTAEDTGFATSSFCLIYVPINKIFTILVVYFAIALKAKVYICKNSRFFKKFYISL